MVTGIEAAGIILASFPLIISALEHYQEGFQAIKEWIRFRGEFATFLNAVVRQKIFFRQNIEELLSPIVSSEYEMSLLLDHPGGSAWADTSLNQRLRQRLPGRYEYESYTTTVSYILEVLHKLKAKLKISDDQPLWVEQPSNSGRLRLEYEMKRIMYTLSRKRRDKLMNQLEKHNGEIQTLLGNSERLEPMRRKRRSPVTRYFHLIRRQAQSLHSALAHAWQCGDSSAHSAKLVLEKRVRFDEKGGHEIEDSTTIKFIVLFCHGRAAQGLTTTSAIYSSSLDWYAAEIESIDSNQDVEQEGSSSSSIGQRPSLLDTQSQRSSCIGSQGTTASNAQSRRVSFLENNAQPASRSVPDDAPEISDLCSVLQRGSSQQGLLGYLKDPQERCHSLSLLEHAQLCNSETQRVLSLDEIIGGKDEASGKATLTRRTRLAIAVVLAHSMLQLHTGPWLCEIWGKKDIHFLQDQDGYIHTEQPFVTHLVSSHAMATENARLERSISRACNSSLLSLGILILELWFNERVESLPFRRGFQGPEGKDNEYTDFNTAQKWQEQAMEEAGLDLHNPTRRCIYCAFGAASQDLEDEELRRAVYSEVVQPLEKLLQRFDVKPR